MLFNSYIFILLFLPITLVLYFICNKFKQYKLAKIELLVASLVFYGYFNLNYLVIIIGSIVINFALNKLFRKLENKEVLRKILLILGIFFNIGMIFFFKYFDFFITNMNTVLKTQFNLLHLLLPLGISFFTFQQLSYIIDVYKKEVPDYSILNYSLFVTFFPQLIAGPIVLHSEIIPQFEKEENKKFNYENFSKGIYAFSLGLGKKVLIADVFGIVATRVFDVLGTGTNSTNLIIGMLAYTMQIYFDFSGYCDMATGIAKMFNINLPMNFNSPYKSYTIVEFWKRWHITLTRFLTNYIYIPLGGNRKGTIRTYLNIIIVFLVSGIWHGANITFILWGLLHGIASIMTRILKKGIEKLNPVFNWLMTFVFINVTWVLFRADTVKQAFVMARNILICNFGNIDDKIVNAFALPELQYVVEHLHLTTLNGKLYMLVFFAVAFFAILCMKNTNEKLSEFRPTIWKMLITIILLLWSLVSLAGVSTFLYFNF